MIDIGRFAPARCASLTIDCDDNSFSKLKFVIFEFIVYSQCFMLYDLKFIIYMVRLGDRI